jgi:hypothetical protein
MHPVNGDSAGQRGRRQLPLRADRLHGRDAIAKAVKAAAGLGPLRAVVITHIGPDWPGGRGPARMLDSSGSETVKAEAHKTQNSQRRAKIPRWTDGRNES